MAIDNTKDIVKKEVNLINKNAEINEAYFIGLMWSDPIANYGQYAETLKSDEFIHDVWGFYYELGRLMYEEGIQKFDDITVYTKVKEYNIEKQFSEYGEMKTIDDAISIVSEHSENIEYYYETVKRNYVIRELYSLFGEKVLLKKGKYDFKKMNREQMARFWGDKLNQISLGNVANYEFEDLYIDGDEFIRKLEEESADMLPYYNSNMLNSISQGIPRGHVTMLGGMGGSGKALALDTPIPTPNGWTTMGDLKVGDKVFGDDGNPTNVIAKSPIFKNHDVYEVTFDDGEKILADAEHQWFVRTDYSYSQSKKGHNKINDTEINGEGFFITTTEAMKDDFVRIRNNGWHCRKYKIPMQKPINYSEKKLLIKPYTLGVWLGDGTASNGCLTVGNIDINEITENIINDGYDISVKKLNDINASKILLKNPNRKTHCEYGHEKIHFWNYLNKKCRECDRIRSNAKYRNEEHELKTIPKYYKSIVQQLRELNILNNKHIPREYLESSIEQRYELLRGIMDSDGYIGKDGFCELAQSNKNIIDGVSELLSSLGIKHSVNKRTTKANGKEFSSYRIHFYTDKNRSCFKLERKKNRLLDDVPSNRNQKSIVDIKKVDTIPTQCIMVDNESHLYLAGDKMTVTHNSSLVAEKFVMSCIQNREKLIVVLNEEDAQSFRQKIVLSTLYHEFHTGIDRKRMVNGKLQDSDKDKIRKAFSKISELMDGENSLIKIVFMEKYVIKDLEKIIKFWANRGYTNLLIDTHKPSDDSPHPSRWETFTEDMKDIYRWSRKNAGGLNLRTLVTFQIADTAIRHRFLDFDAIGEGKKAKNEASVMYMFRKVWHDEYEDESKALNCYRLRKNSRGGYDKEFFNLQKGKTYYLLFTPKNRFGQSSETGQPILVIEPLFNANAFKEVGWCHVIDDKGTR